MYYNFVTYLTPTDTKQYAYSKFVILLNSLLAFLWNSLFLTGSEQNKLVKVTVVPI